jgi:hypothetical protein
MADKNKSIIDEALMDAKRIQETLNANTKEILRSIAKEEIDELVKESLNEFEEEDVDVDVDSELDVDAEVSADELDDIEIDIDDVESLDTDDSAEGDLEIGDEIELDADASMGDEIDMTDASDDEVLAIYKKLSGDDEIEVVSVDNGDMELTVNEPGEFIIRGADEETADEETADDETADDETADEETAEPEMDLEVSIDDLEVSVDDLEDSDEDDLEDSDEDEVEETYESYNMDESDVVYEIELDDMTDEEEVIDEKIQVGKGRNVTTKKTKIEGAGGRANKVTRPNVTTESTKYVSIDDYNKLLNEAKALKSKTVELTGTLKEQRKMLGKVVVFNTNLTNVTRLFTEHSTTKDEKRAIIERFDDEVSNINESKKLFKSIEKELANKKPITESVAKTTSFSNVKSTSSSNLNENTAYVDNGTKRIIDLISRVENSDKY